MKYKDMTPHELTEKTVKDIDRRRQMEKNGRRQALRHCMENRDKIQKRISHGRY